MRYFSHDVLRDRQLELAYLGILMPFNGRIPGWVASLVVLQSRTTMAATVVIAYHSHFSHLYSL